MIIAKEAYKISKMFCELSCDLNPLEKALRRAERIILRAAQRGEGGATIFKIYEGTVGYDKKIAIANRVVGVLKRLGFFVHKSTCTPYTTFFVDWNLRD